MRYSEILQPGSSFQRSVNLSLDADHLSFINAYIPTKASASVLERYLLAVETPGSDRASLLIGPYGKGKSHTLFIAIAVLSMEGIEAEQAFSLLAKKLDNVNPNAAALVRNIREKKHRLLPVIINDRYMDARQAFLASLKAALSQRDLQALMPDNYFERCAATIARWKQEYPSTYQAFQQYMEKQGTNVVDFDMRLAQCDHAALQLFCNCHRSILSGAEFDPMLESDVPTLYRRVAEALKAQTPYQGLFIVFDEFGKYLETAVASHEPQQFKVLQDLAELCGRSGDTCMLLVCITHKTIGEYASHLTQVQQASFRTVEGRFTPIYFISTFEGSFSLIAGALGRDATQYRRFLKKHIQERDALCKECEQLVCFSGYESSIEEIVDQCFPMHPLTALTLMKLSEHAAQNERTLFTFLADSQGDLAKMIRKNRGEYQLADMTMVYDYFHASIRENSYNPSLQTLVIFTDALIPTLPPDEAKLVKAVVLLSMVVDASLSATEAVLCAGLRWNKTRFDTACTHLEQTHRIYKRRSDGVLCIMRSATETVRQAIDAELYTRRARHMDIADQLTELRQPGFTIPRRYNDQHEMVRFFQNVFLSADRFFKYRSGDFLKAYGFADGYVMYLLGSADVKEVQNHLRTWKAEHVIVLLPSKEFAYREVIEECAAIHSLLEAAPDEVAAEELGYYFDDMLQVVNRTFTDLFESQPTFITQATTGLCHSVGAQASCLCEETLYPASPVICHEMMNRTMLTGAMRKIRENVIDAILTHENAADVFQPNSAEAVVLNAVISRTAEQKQMRVVQGLIRNFILSCEQQKRRLSEITEPLIDSPYGMRKGVLPIIIAHVLKQQTGNATLYYQQKEQSITGETLSLLDDHASELYLLLDRGSSAQTAYLQALHDAYTPDEATPSIRNIYQAMCRVIKALPRCARANRKLLIEGTNGVRSVDLPVAAMEIRRTLINVEGNARDALLEKLPKTIGLPIGNDCAQHIIDMIKSELCDYTKRLTRALSAVVRLQFGSGNSGSTVRGAMTAWLSKQSTARLTRVYDSETTALLSVIRCADEHTESEWINMLAVALTGLPIDDWSDLQAPSFPGMLEHTVTSVEQAEEPEHCENQIEVVLGKRVLRQSLKEHELDGLASVVYDSLRSTLEEYADAISAEDKLLVLANLMLRLSEKE